MNCNALVLCRAEDEVKWILWQDMLPQFPSLRILISDSYFEYDGVSGRRDIFAASVSL